MDQLEVIAFVGLVALVLIAYAIKEQRLRDPSNNETVFLDQLRSACLLRDGPVSAALIRQSGNLYRDLGFFDDWGAAFDEIEKSFRRARIESLHISKNTPDRFEVVRLHHSHGGKAEGKKLGGAVIAVE